MFKENTRYKIKTPTGFERFEGILIKKAKRMYCITFEDNTYIKCSDGHAFLTDTGFIQAKNLTKNNTVTGKRISSISYENGEFDVYDPVNVDKHNTYYSNGVISHNTEFLGSSNTLINPAKIQQLIADYEDPREIRENMAIYELPKEGHTYCMTVDVSEGLGLDYSTFSVFDVTQIPYKQVAKFRDNKISLLLFPTRIVQVAQMYNEAFVLVEINSIGLQVADIIHHELAYENLIKIEMKGKQGQQHTPGFKKKIAFGIKTSKQTKMIGCTNVKSLIENDKLIIKDLDTINELTTFVVENQIFKAEEGCNDDLAMTLVHFGWLTGQRYFKENIDNDIRKTLQLEQMNVMDQDIVPFGLIDNGLDDPFDKNIDADGDVWITDRKSRYPFDMLEYDILSNKYKL